MDPALINAFERMLIEEEKCASTRKKYVRDVKALLAYLGEPGCVTKAAVIAYKQHLTERYAVATVNAMLASINSFFKKMSWYDCVVKSLRVQQAAFRPPERELTKAEYYRLLQTAKAQGNERLYLLMQTLCGTGIRISELPFITVEAVTAGRARVTLKGKTRAILLSAALCRELRRYTRARRIRTGSVFVTRGGRPVDRSNVFREMKAICTEAGVDPRKVFPHNLRHLFACTYYQAEKDISHLADLLGHSSINTTRIYLMKSSAEQARQLEHLGLVI